MELFRPEPYYLIDTNKVEELYDATYMGDWSIRNKYDSWTSRPVAVFYVKNPDTTKNHSHYFGLFIDYVDQSLKICNAESAFSEPMVGIEEDGIVYVSRYRHDFVTTPSGSTIDGGRDGTYMGGSTIGSTLSVTVEGSNFIFT